MDGCLWKVFGGEPRESKQRPVGFRMCIPRPGALALIAVKNYEAGNPKCTKDHQWPVEIRLATDREHGNPSSFEVVTGVFGGSQDEGTIFFTFNDNYQVREEPLGDIRGHQGGQSR